MKTEIGNIFLSRADVADYNTSGGVVDADNFRAHIVVGQTADEKHIVHSYDFADGPRRSGGGIMADEELLDVSKYVHQGRFHDLSETTQESIEKMWLNSVDRTFSRLSPVHPRFNHAVINTMVRENFFGGTETRVRPESYAFNKIRDIVAKATQSDIWDQPGGMKTDLTQLFFGDQPDLLKALHDPDLSSIRGHLDVIMYGDKQVNAGLVGLAHQLDGYGIDIAPYITEQVMERSPAARRDAAKNIFMAVNNSIDRRRSEITGVGRAFTSPQSQLDSLRLQRSRLNFIKDYSAFDSETLQKVGAKAKTLDAEIRRINNQINRVSGIMQGRTMGDELRQMELGQMRRRVQKSIDQIHNQQVAGGILSKSPIERSYMLGVVPKGNEAIARLGEKLPIGQAQQLALDLAREWGLQAPQAFDEGDVVERTGGLRSFFKMEEGILKRIDAPSREAEEMLSRQAAVVGRFTRGLSESKGFRMAVLDNEVLVRKMLRDQADIWADWSIPITRDAAGKATLGAPALIDLVGRAEPVSGPLNSIHRALPQIRKAFEQVELNQIHKAPVEDREVWSYFDAIAEDASLARRRPTIALADTAKEAFLRLTAGDPAIEELLAPGIRVIEAGDNLETLAKLMRQIADAPVGTVPQSVDTMEAVDDMRRAMAQSVREAITSGNYAKITPEVAHLVKDLNIPVSQVKDILRGSAKEISEVSAGELLFGFLRKARVPDTMKRAPIGPDSPFVAGRTIMRDRKQATVGLLVRDISITDGIDKAMEPIYLQLSQVHRAPAPAGAMSGRSLFTLWEPRFDPSRGSVTPIEGYRELDKGMLEKIFGMQNPDERDKLIEWMFDRGHGGKVISAEEKRRLGTELGRQLGEADGQQALIERIMAGIAGEQAVAAETDDVAKAFIAYHNYAKQFSMGAALETAATGLGGYKAGLVSAWSEPIAQLVAAKLRQNNKMSVGTVNLGAFFRQGTSELDILQDAGHMDRLGATYLASIGAPVYPAYRREAPRLLAQDMVEREWGEIPDTLSKALGFSTREEMRQHALMQNPKEAYLRGFVGIPTEAREINKYLETLEAKRGATGFDFYKSLRGTGLEPVLRHEYGGQTFTIPTSSKARLREGLQAIESAGGLESLLTRLEGSASAGILESMAAGTGKGVSVREALANTIQSGISRGELKPDSYAYMMPDGPMREFYDTTISDSAEWMMKYRGQNVAQLIKDGTIKGEEFGRHIKNINRAYTEEMIRGGPNAGAWYFNAQMPDAAERVAEELLVPAGTYQGMKLGQLAGDERKLQSVLGRIQGMPEYAGLYAITSDFMEAQGFKAKTYRKYTEAMGRALTLGSPEAIPPHLIGKGVETTLAAEGIVKKAVGGGGLKRFGIGVIAATAMVGLAAYASGKIRNDPLESEPRGGEDPLNHLLVNQPAGVEVNWVDSELLNKKLMLNIDGRNMPEDFDHEAFMGDLQSRLGNRLPFNITGSETRTLGWGDSPMKPNEYSNTQLMDNIMRGPEDPRDVIHMPGY